MDEKKIELSVSPNAKDYLGRAGYDPQFGARPLKRTIQNVLQNPLARMILNGEIKEGDKVLVDRDQDDFSFSTLKGSDQT